MFRCLFHVHTRRSYDSLLSPAKILAHARAANVDVVIVTDHNTIRGAQEVHASAQGRPKVVIASEYKTDKGDIIGLFLNHEVRSRSARDAVAEIHAQGGLVVLPHPYKAHMLDDELLAGVDLIETRNSRCSEHENERAAELAEKLQIPIIGGADAHCLGELSTVINIFDAAPPASLEALRHALLHAPRRIEFRRASGKYRPYSQIIKAVRTRNPVLFLSQAKRLATTLMQETWS